MTTTLEQPTLERRVDGTSDAAEWAHTPCHYELTLTPAAVERIVYLAELAVQHGLTAVQVDDVPGFNYQAMEANSTDDGEGDEFLEFDDRDRVLYYAEVHVYATQAMTYPTPSKRINVRVSFMGKWASDESWFYYYLAQKPDGLWEITA